MIEQEEQSLSKSKKKKAGINKDLLNSMGDLGGEDDILEEDEFYEQVKRKKESKKKEKMKLEEEEDDDQLQAEEEETGKRLATNQMLKNRGLTPKRNKELKNPRVKRRKQYEKASKKLKHVVRQAKVKEQPYQGELTGIKANVSRSVKIKS